MPEKQSYEELEQRVKELEKESIKSKEAEETLKALLNAPTETAILIDPDGWRILAINEVGAQRLGKSVDELIGMGIYDYLPRDLADSRKAQGDKVVRSGKSVRYQDEREGRFYDNNLYPVFDAQGKVGRIAIFASDITERKRAEEEKRKLEAQLIQTQKIEAIGILAGGIAHNFNNLLTGIQGNASLMLLETDSNHPNYQRLKIIEKSVQSGSRLTSQLLGYARKGGYEIRPISLNQLVEETSDTFATTKKEIRVHQELAEDLFGINADQGQIEQVLLNLYVNASGAMPGGGDLFLKTMNMTHKDMRGKPYRAKPGNYVLLTVRDTGIGMDKRTMERIFEPFFTTKEMGRGTGLGLASVYGIIKAHGGYIDVDSERGHGTTFEIYLPASEKRVEKAANGAEQIIEGSGTILLVDDEEMVLDVGIQLLKALGYTVLQARGGREAVEIYQKNKDNIDMVILGMVMPDMDGGVAYDRMKEINPDIRVLLSSGYGIDGEATEILERGCDGFIQKPFSIKELSQEIREILDKK